MARSNIRVLALDLDGTLTNDEKIVTPRTRAALDAAAAQGVTIVLGPPAAPQRAFCRWQRSWGWTKRAAVCWPTTAARSWTA